MFRTKITLLYALLVAVLTALVVMLVQWDVTRSLEEQAEVSLRRAATLAEQSARLDEATLMEKARFVAESPRLYESMLLQPPVDEDGEPVEFRPGTEEDPAYQRHLSVHEKLLAQKYRLDEIAKEVGDARDVELGLLERRPREFEMFVAVDQEGRGVAALGKDLYSWWGNDLTRAFPEIEEMLQAENPRPKVAFWHWSFKAENEKRLYRVAMVPVRESSSQEPRGVVILGSILNDGLARQKQRLVAGLTHEQGEDELGAAYRATAPEVAFFRGSDIVGSTFGADRQLALAKAMSDAKVFDSDEPEVLLDLAVDGKPYYGLVRFFRGEFGAEQPVGVMVLASLEKARAPVDDTKVNIILLGAVFLVLGSMVIFMTANRFERPLESLESGIQEVIAGNKDYTWQPQQGHSLQASLAQGLNVMSAYLQGKPMPDDENLGGSWGDLMDLEEGSRDEGPGEVTGIDLGDLGAARKPRDDEDA